MQLSLLMFTFILSILYWKGLLFNVTIMLVACREIPSSISVINLDEKMNYWLNSFCILIFSQINNWVRRTYMLSEPPTKLTKWCSELQHQSKFFWSITIALLLWLSNKKMFNHGNGINHTTITSLQKAQGRPLFALSSALWNVLLS